MATNKPIEWPTKGPIETYKGIDCTQQWRDRIVELTKQNEQYKAEAEAQKGQTLSLLRRLKETDTTIHPRGWGPTPDFLKLTGYKDDAPIWVNPATINAISLEGEDGSRIALNGTTQVFVQESPDQVLNLTQTR